MTYMATRQCKNPCPGGHESYNSSKPFLGHHYYILSLIHLCLGVEKKILKEKMHFYHITYMATPQHKNPCPGRYEIYNFGRPFLGHHYFILTLSDICLGVEKKIFRELMYFHYITYMVTPQSKNPCPWGHEMYNIGRPFLVHHNYILSLPNLCQRVEKKIFKEIHQFYTFQVT